MEKVLYGKLAKKLPIEEGITPKGNNWKKMQFLLEEEGDYKNQIIITLLNNKVDLLKHFKLGDNISVYYNIQCREYKGKYYTDIQAWQIRSHSSNITAKAGLNGDMANEFNRSQNVENNSLDLPF